MELLDIKTLQTVDDLNNIYLKKYTDTHHTNWVRNIKYPVEQEEFDRLHKLSKSKDSIYLFYNSMGDLYFQKKN